MTETNKHWSTEVCKTLAAMVQMEGPGKSITAPDPTSKRVHPGRNSDGNKRPPCGESLQAIPIQDEKIQRHDYARQRQHWNYHCHTGQDLSQKGIQNNTKHVIHEIVWCVAHGGQTCSHLKSKVMSDLTKLISEWREKEFHQIVMDNFNSETHERDMVPSIETKQTYQSCWRS